MNETTEKAKRPTSITVICVMGFVGVLMVVSSVLIFPSQMLQVGSWFVPYVGFSVVVGLACMVGLWMMKKWAAYAYAGLAVLSQVILLTMGVWNVMDFLIPAIIIFFLMKNVSKMT